LLDSGVRRNDVKKIIQAFLSYCRPNPPNLVGPTEKKFHNRNECVKTEIPLGLVNAERDSVTIRD
jgi:hypothetical protein